MARTYGVRMGALLMGLGLAGVVLPGLTARLGLSADPGLGTVHLVTGALLVAAGLARTPARLAAQISGVAYMLIAAIGFIDGVTVLGWFPVTLLSNIVHLGVGLLGQYAGFGRAAGGT